MKAPLEDVRDRLSQVTDPMSLLVGLFAHAPLGLQVYLPSGQCLLTNQAFRDIFGTEPPPEYNLWSDPLLPGTGVLELARRAFAGETVSLPPMWYDTTKQPLVSSGTPRRCAIASTWMPLFDAAGRVSHVVILFRDVTAELSAQEQLEADRDRLRELQGRMQAFLDNAPVICFIKDLEGKHVVINREARRAFGFNEESVEGKSASELFGAAYAARSTACDRYVLETRQPQQQVDTLPTLAGMRPFLVTRFPIFGAGAEPVGVGGIAVDLSERAEVEELLRKSEARFQQVFRSLPMGAIISRLSDKRFLDVNEAWLKMTGFSRQETIGKTSVELGLWHDPARRDELFRELGERGFVRDFSARLDTKSGAMRELLLSVDRVELGGEECVLLLAHDVTALRELEGELRQSQKMDAVGRLAGGVAHDFNNILTAMAGADTLLIEGLADGDPLRRYAEQIKKSIARAATLTRQLLTFTRKQPMQPVVVDPNEAVRATVDMLQRMIGADVELRTELDARGRVRADPGALEQVLMNLAVNARDAMPAGGRLTIRTADVDGGNGVPDGAWLLLDVADTGVGMDAKTRARVFEPFFTTKEQGKGTGLGLSTVYGIVTQSGGHIAVDSEPERGARFRIYLPRLPGERATPAPVTAREALPRGRETVLLAEDDEAVRDFVHFVLARLGYRVIEAGDGVEALEKAAAHDGAIDLLLSDVVMPRMDGRELARRLVEARPGLKVIHMSGYPGGSTEAAPLHDGETHLLIKPFERDQLARLVRATLDGVAAE